MQNWILIATFAVAVLFATGLAIYLSRRIDRVESHYVGTVVNKEQQLMEEIERLNIVIQQLSRRIVDLETQLAETKERLTKSNVRIEQLEALGHLAQTTAQELAAVSTLITIPVKPLLVIGGTSQDVLDRDLQALTRARIRLQRISTASKALIEAEVRRRRQDKPPTLYPWVHISAHAGPAGILLVDGLAEPAFWLKVLVGVKIVVMAACEDITSADAIAGMVDTVVSFTESVGTQDAADFTYAFWKRIIAGKNADIAYREALDEVPQVAMFVDLRHG